LENPLSVLNLAYNRSHSSHPWDWYIL